MDKKKVLGLVPSGFAYGFIVEEGLRRGYEVWAGVRVSTSRKYLADERIRFVEFDFSDYEQIKRMMTTTLPEGEKWIGSYIISAQPNVSVSQISPKSTTTI